MPVIEGGWHTEDFVMRFLILFFLSLVMVSPLRGDTAAGGPAAGGPVGCGMRNVRDYGATGDGKTPDTAAIQRAIDAGGIVHFPAGTYLSGTIYLKSGGGLDLAPGALLLASTDPGDYNASDFCPQNRPDSPAGPPRPMDWVSGAHLIVALEQRDVVIRGGGTISGNQDAFGPIAVEDPAGRLTTPMPWRPGELIWFCESDRVTIQNVNLIDAPFWTCLIQGCNEVLIDNIRLSMNVWTRNGDGITIDSSRNVAVSNCVIRSGDDCLVIKADHRRLKRRQACENVVVSNCVLESTCYGVRVGVGNGVMRNVRVDNVVARCRIAAYIGLDWGLVKEIENITFTNFTVNAETAIMIDKSRNQLKRDPRDVVIRDIVFRNFRGSAARVAAVTPNVPVRNIVIDNVDIRLRQLDRSLCPYRELPAWRAPVELFRVDGVRLSNIRIDWADPYKTFYSSFYTEQCSGMRIDDCDFGGRSEWGAPGGYPPPTAGEKEYQQKWVQLY